LSPMAEPSGASSSGEPGENERGLST
jgi:hypothetical protein